MSRILFSWSPNLILLLVSLNFLGKRLLIEQWGIYLSAIVLSLFTTNPYDTLFFLGQKCLDPCPGSCGVQAVCTVDTHNPICSCSAGFTGDPFTRCLQEQRPPPPIPPRDPCNPSPCGLNANCRVQGSRAVCSCIKDYQVIHFS